MPKVKQYAINIPRLYKWQSLDMIAFGYVQGLRAGNLHGIKTVLPAVKDTDKVPTISVTKALEMFLDAFDLCEDDYCLENASAAYYRVFNSLVEIRDGYVDDVQNIIL